MPSKVAQQDLERLHPQIQLDILSSVKLLCDPAFHRRKAVKKLEGKSVATHRLRVGDYRVGYRIEGSTVFVLFIADRKNVKRRLKSLSKFFALGSESW